MSLEKQTSAVKVAIQNAFATLNTKLGVEVTAAESRAVDYTNTRVIEGTNTVVRYNPVIVENSAEVEYQKGQEESFADVFNNWKRISHNNTDTYPANAGELDSWAYDAVNDTISCTINSATLVGFISPEGFENYNFEVQVNSSNTDDDQIGICIAYKELNGREYTLTALRNPQGGGINATARFQIVYNYRQSDEQVIAETSAGLTTAAGWGPMVSGVKIRAERTGDAFVIKTTDNDGTVYVAAAELAVDLNALAVLAKFKGTSQYGYVAFSQAASTWDTLARPIALDEILDVTNRIRWTYDGSVWTSETILAGDPLVDPRRFFYNEATGKLYVSDDASDVHEILLDQHRTSGDHDARYYTRTELDNNLQAMVDAAYSGGHTHPWSQITEAPATATRWPAWTEVTAKPADFPPSTHNHDLLYYPRAEVDTFLAAKVDTVVGKGLSEEDFTTLLLTKLNGIEAGATATSQTDLSTTISATQLVVISSNGTNATLPSATTLNSGVMSAADKTKLDGVQALAEVNLPTTASRASVDTGTVLQAKGMSDHVASTDHDARYNTKAEVTGLLSGKVDIASIVDNRLSMSTTVPLAANQGRLIQAEIDRIDALMTTDTTTLDTLQEVVDFIKLNRADLDTLTIASIAGLQTALNAKVDVVAGKALSENDFTTALLNKLNGIEAGATATSVTDLTQSRNATSYTVISSTGTNTTLQAATETAAGVLTGADKAKLNGIEASANNYVHPSNAFSMAALTGASVISDINVDGTGHVSTVSTRNLSKADIGLSNVPNTDATNASNLASGTVPAARLTGTYAISVSGNAATATSLATARTINGVSFNGTANITVADNTKVAKSGDTMTGRLNIGGTDDGIHELQVDGESSLRGNVGVNNSNPTHAVDVDGDVRVRQNHASKFGGTGANDEKFEIRYNSATESLDFNYLG